MALSLVAWPVGALPRHPLDFCFWIWTCSRLVLLSEVALAEFASQPFQSLSNQRVLYSTP